MNRKRWIMTVLSVSIVAFCGVSFSQETAIREEWLKAFDSNDQERMTAIVKEKQEEVPAEIRSLVDEALLSETTGEERVELFYLAERMARSYMEVTGDAELLKGVKQRIFESKISPPVPTMRDKQAHVVEAIAQGEENYLFMPNNIVIKKGETVRWVNSDTVDHLVGSVPFIGLGGIMTPLMKPGESLEYHFKEAGEYYYVCFIHKVMYGKVTVEE